MHALGFSVYMYVLHFLIYPTRFKQCAVSWDLPLLHPSNWSLSKYTLPWTTLLFSHTLVGCIFVHVHTASWNDENFRGMCQNMKFEQTVLLFITVMFEITYRGTSFHKDEFVFPCKQIFMKFRWLFSKVSQCVVKRSVSKIQFWLVNLGAQIQFFQTYMYPCL